MTSVSWAPRALGSAAGCWEVDLIPWLPLAVAQVSYPEAALVESHSALPSSSWLSSVATAALPGIPPSLCSSSLSTQQPQPASKTHPGPLLKPSQASSISGGSPCGGHLLTSPIWPLCQSHWTLGSFLAEWVFQSFGHFVHVIFSACSCLPTLPDRVRLILQA